MQDDKNTSISPFLYGANAQKEIHQPVLVEENNKHRTFRHYGNACELVAGAAINSAVVFSFHLLQVHPVGILLALGVSHFYFTATAASEESKRFNHVMTGAAASLSMLTALSEPVSEWMEARHTQESFEQTVIELQPETSAIGSWFSGLPIGLPILVLVLLIALMLGRSNR